MQMAISISRVQFEHHREALGIQEQAPRLSWRFKGDAVDWTQTGYEVEITGSTGVEASRYRVDSASSVLVPWPGKKLCSGESTSVRVRAFGNDNAANTDWSELVTAEAGLLERLDWTGCFIGSGTLVDTNAPRQPVVLRRTFHLAKTIQKARLYITAHGLYEAYLNGHRIGDHVLAPGWTSYTHRLHYQTYDVTDLLFQGDNVLAAQIAEGWYCGRLGFLGGKRNIWGDDMSLLAKLVITQQDEQTIVVDTDSQWKSSFDTLITSELYDGEVCDLRLSQGNWQLPSFNDEHWAPVRTLPLPAAELVAPDGPPVKKIEEIKPITTFQSPSGQTIVDFGQNLVGWVRIKLSGPKSHTIKLQFAEALDNGEVATRPLRGAKAADTIILSGDDVEWEPKFTFHGFQYVQIEGLLEEMTFDESKIVAVVVHTDMEQTGWLETSNPLLNQLHNNVKWSMKGNFVSIPSDCPQRDERLGWTGDIHVFAPTANYLYDTCGMLRSWAKDLAAEQMADGSGVPPFFVPNVFLDDPREPTAIWGDVAVGLPWALYTSYGDINILKSQLKSMEAWVERGIIRDTTNNLWKPGVFQFSDWLDPMAPSDDPGNSITDTLLVANAYLVHITNLMSQISATVGDTKQSEYYSQTFKSLKVAFQDLYITPHGRVVSDSQTALTLAIHFQLFKSSDQEKVATERLKELILRNSRFKIATGFAGTPLIGHALSRVGLHQLFYRMLYHKKVPSWLYQVTMGATTMWERWDSMLPDRSINPGEMTSFNHYALGSVADWMHSNIGGVKPLEPGWKRFQVAPVPGGDLEHANAKFLSPYGLITVFWEIVADTFHLKVTIPPNTTAEITLPGKQPHQAIVTGSGTKQFQADYKRPAWPPIPEYPKYYPHDDDEP